MECARGLKSNFKRSVGDGFPAFVDGIESSASAGDLVSRATAQQNKAAVSCACDIPIVAHWQWRSRHLLPCIFAQVVDGAVQTWPKAAGIVGVEMAVAAPDQQVVIDYGGNSTDACWHGRQR